VQVYDKSSWFVSSKDVPKFRRSVILSSMFPSGKSYQDLGDSNCNVDMEDDITSMENEKTEDGIEALENPVMAESAEEVSDFPLEHCMRIMPHDQNTGAFFIAVLQKVSPLPGSLICNNILPPPHTLSLLLNSQEILVNKGNNSKFLYIHFTWTFAHNIGFVSILAAVLEKPSKQSLDDAQAPHINSSETTLEEVFKAVPEENVNDNVSNTDDLEDSPLTREERNSEETEEPRNAQNTVEKVPGKRKLQYQGKWRGVDPVVFFKDEAIVNSIKNFYGIDERFPFNGHLVTRNLDNSNAKRIYYVSKSVKDIVVLNFSVGQQLKMTSVGMKMFVSILYSHFRDIVVLAKTFIT